MNDFLFAQDIPQQFKTQSCCFHMPGTQSDPVRLQMEQTQISPSNPRCFGKEQHQNAGEIHWNSLMNFLIRSCVKHCPGFLAKPMSYNVFQRDKIHVPSFFSHGRIRECMKSPSFETSESSIGPGISLGSLTFAPSTPPNGLPLV